MEHPTFYRTAQIDDLSIYREAGPPGAQTLLLLHGFPSSSRMFELDHQRKVMARHQSAFHGAGGQALPVGDAQQ